LEAARRSLVLLKNDNNILPLSKKATIALIGPNAANNPITSYGSSEITEPAPITNIKEYVIDLLNSIDAVAFDNMVNKKNSIIGRKIFFHLLFAHAIVKQYYFYNNGRQSFWTMC
jgi:beta-glucosidase